MLRYVYCSLLSIFVNVARFLEKTVYSLIIEHRIIYILLDLRTLDVRFFYYRNKQDTFLKCMTDVEQMHDKPSPAHWFNSSFIKTNFLLSVYFKNKILFVSLRRDGFVEKCGHILLQGIPSSKLHNYIGKKDTNQLNENECLAAIVSFACGLPIMSQQGEGMGRVV